MPGPYIAQPADLVPRATPYGNGQCVALVEALCGAPHHVQWREGARLADLISQPPGIATGTAIATFIAGTYPSKPTGNHAAIFVSAAADRSSVVVFDQWAGQPPHLRTLYFGRAAGSYSVNNRPEAYSVIL
jgi:hypothetical protein